MTSSADSIVAATCRNQGLVLVTHNVKHFRSISQSYEAKKKKPDHLCRVLLDCKQLNSPQRIRDVLDLVEAEWDRLGPLKQGLHIAVGDGWIRLHR